MRSLLTALLLVVFAVLSIAQTPAPTPYSLLGPTYHGSRLGQPCSPHFIPPSMKLIPGGEYEMGDHSGSWYYDERPVHEVYIDTFYMDIFEVTNEQYCAFLNWAYGLDLIDVAISVVYKKNDTEPYCETHPGYQDSHVHWNGSGFTAVPGKEDHPVVTVSWYGAVAFANWRSIQEGLTPCYDLDTWECNYGGGGFRLPTEAEWEKAARGGEHSPYTDYPWGNSIDGSKANYWYSGDPYEVGYWPYTTPVAYYDGSQTPPGADMANGYGLYDMSGNVWEWCNDWYYDYYYQYCVDNGISVNPTGPSTSPSETHVLRSGSWGYYDYSLRCSYRNLHYGPVTLSHDVGFRLVLD